ncbi:type I restriction-modification enzyme R subunit C-terminal domain-containing protein [Micromonospora echinofusca]|uniref:type I restriction-modification enzyme R subunit C-terminal domain-containing protein n=1 Tax=Micromonospora echinofusca TaxID=47858 RepID=UPI0033D247CD
MSGATGRLSVRNDPRTACFYARRTLEHTLTWLFEADRTLASPYKKDLAAMIHEPTLRHLVGPALHAKMEIIRKQGNWAVHKSAPVRSTDSMPVVRELFHVLYWVARRYTRDQSQVPPSALAFDETIIPRPTHGSPHQTSQADLKALADKLAAQDATLAAERAKNASLDAELAKLRAQVAAAKAANEARPDDHDYDEAQTRDLFVDVLLKEAGWALDQPRDRELPVTGMPNGSGAGVVDYVLWGDDGKPLAVVEAKRARRDATAGQQQAKLYADCLEQAYGQRPVIFCTNGYEHWLWDDTAYPPRPVQGFYTKAELHLLVQRRETRRPLVGAEINERIVERHYQKRAIGAVGEAFDEFLVGRSLTKNQLHFIHMLIGHLTQNGMMEIDRLYESPFTEIAPHGPESLFASDDVDRIVSILRSVRATAAPAHEVA